MTPDTPTSVPSELPRSGTATDDTREPYRIWPETMPFRRNGTPVVGSMGSSVRRVVIMDAEVFQRLVRENPQLATARFEVASYE